MSPVLCGIVSQPEVKFHVFIPSQTRERNREFFSIFIQEQHEDLIKQREKFLSYGFDVKMATARTHFSKIQLQASY